MSQSKKCKKCQQLIQSDQEYLHDDEDVLHINCYLCSNCHQSLAGKFYYRYKDPRTEGKRKIFCESCYYRLAPVCFHCLKIIDDISLIYGERIFHPNCFLCHHCQKPFRGTLVFPYENQVYCAKCYPKIQGDFRPADASVSTLRCSICRKKFEAGDLVTEHRVCLEGGKIESSKGKGIFVKVESIMNSKEEIDKKIYYIHNSCFVCEICHKNLSNGLYYSPNQPDKDIEQIHFQCQKCHEISPNICSGCFKPSDDLMIIFNNRWYHDQCFKCKHCDYQLKDLSRIITESDGLSCERCLKSIHNQEQQLEMSNT